MNNSKVCISEARAGIGIQQQFTASDVTTYCGIEMCIIISIIIIIMITIIIIVIIIISHCCAETKLVAVL